MNWNIKSNIQLFFVLVSIFRKYEVILNIRTLINATLKVEQQPTSK